jgi:hypothetical protein
MREFSAAYSMMDNIMPQVLECEDAFLNAQCFSCLADAQMGMAGTKKGTARNECLHRALEFIDRSFAGEFHPGVFCFPPNILMEARVLSYTGYEVADDVDEPEGPDTGLYGRKITSG